MLQPGMQLSPINPPTTLPPEYGAFPRVVTPHSHSQSPTSHPPQPAVVSSYSTHLSNKLSDHGIGTGYPVFSPQQTQGLLTMDPPNHGQYSPLRNQPIVSYGVGGGAHMQQKQTTLMQMPQVQLPLKAEGGADSEAKAVQKGRKRPLSHSGSASSTDNLGKTALKYTLVSCPTQKRRKRPLSHSGSASSTDNLGKTALKYTLVSCPTHVHILARNILVSEFWVSISR